MAWTEQKKQNIITNWASLSAKLWKFVERFGDDLQKVSGHNIEGGVRSLEAAVEKAIALNEAEAVRVAFRTSLKDSATADGTTNAYAEEQITTD